MEPIDYTRSFVHGTSPFNRVRFMVEARTRLFDMRNGDTQDYVVCASCKSEDTFAKEDLFYEDNYDFLPIFGPGRALVFRSRAYANDDYRRAYATEELWGGPRYRLTSPRSVTELHTNADIREATHAGLLLIGQTEWSNSDHQLGAIVEYPVKTMNIHDDQDLYQVDTGPIAYADLSIRPTDPIDVLHLAFVAYNREGYAEFILEAATPIIESRQAYVRVPHFSQRVRVDAENRLFAIE